MRCFSRLVPPTPRLTVGCLLHRRRSVEAAAIMKQVYAREWGALVMDEVHMMPAEVGAAPERCSGPLLWAVGKT